MNRKMLLISTMTLLVTLPVSQNTLAEKSMTSKPGHGKQKTLLLPAVQAAREAARVPLRSRRTVPDNRRFSSGRNGPAADTTCTGVNSCNDMIATCIALGGTVTPTSYDRKTGAPNGATCFD